MKYITVILILISSNVGYAQTCTYGQGQNKMVKFNNMMQEYSREFISLMKATGDSKPELEKKRLAMAEESSKIGILLSEESEKNNNIQFSNPINPVICDSFDALMKKYAPKGYQSQVVTVKPTATSSTCNSTSLWKRYGAAIQKQKSLVSEGKITKDEVNDYMTLGTYVGQYSTTDLNKACEYLEIFEDKLDAE